MVRLQVSGYGYKNLEIVTYAKRYESAVANIGESRYSLCRYIIAKYLGDKVPEYDKLTIKVVDYFERASAPKKSQPLSSRLLAECSCEGKEFKTHYCPLHGQQ
jgi:hypothetical protein